VACARKACDRAGQHDAAEQAAHDIADNATARRIRRHVGGEGDKHLHGDRAHADAERRDQEQRRCRGEGCADQGEGGEQDQGQHELAVFQQIAERHDQQQAEAVADLRQRHDQPCRCRAEAERGADRAGERLAVVEVGGDQSAGCCEQECHER
jgi:hypothetical protein